MTAPDGDGLAEVIYFPGVAPPSGAAVTESVDAPPVGAAPVREPTPSRGPAASTRAENIAMHALTRRGQSRRELEAILASRELDPDTVEAELERLESVGLIDDAALAEQIIRIARERKKLGRAAIVAELKRRKLDRDTIEGALSELDDDGDADSELDRATELARDRARRLTSLDRETAVRRLSGFLQRKGYAGDTVRLAVSRALEGQNRPGHRGTVHFR